MEGDAAISVRRTGAATWGLGDWETEGSGSPTRKIPVGKGFTELQFASQAKFAFGVAQMGFNGGGGNEQLFSDFLVGIPQAGQGGDFFFSGSEGLPGF